MPKLNPKIREAATRAADWLEANPDKHLQVNMAADKHGRPVSTTDPEATCFCAAGRLAHELGVSIKTDYIPLFDLLGGSTTREIYGANDIDRRLGILKLRELSA